jgi:hypothetical protein
LNALGSRPSTPTIVTRQQSIGEEPVQTSRNSLKRSQARLNDQTSTDFHDDEHRLISQYTARLGNFYETQKQQRQFSNKTLPHSTPPNDNSKAQIFNEKLKKAFEDLNQNTAVRRFGLNEFFRVASYVLFIFG